MIQHLVLVEGQGVKKNTLKRQPRWLDCVVIVSEFRMLPHNLITSYLNTTAICGINLFVTAYITKIMNSERHHRVCKCIQCTIWLKIEVQLICLITGPVVLASAEVFQDPHRFRSAAKEMCLVRTESPPFPDWKEV